MNKSFPCSIPQLKKKKNSYSIKVQKFRPNGTVSICSYQAKINRSN